MTATINPTRNVKAAAPPSATAIDRIHFDLDELVSRHRREIWLGGILAIGTAMIVSLLFLLVLDAIFRPESTWLRVAMWVPMIGVVGMITRHFLMWPLKAKSDRLAMAWTLEQEQPAIEERLTTSLQLSGNAQGKRSTIVEAVAQQAHSSLAGCQEEDLRGQEVFHRTIVAGACLAIFVLSMWVWSPYLLPSLQNVLNPLGSRVPPHLNAVINPGDTHVAEGGDLRVTAAASHLSDAVLEVIEGEAVIASHQMATEENVGNADFTLRGLKSDRQYRIRSGGLYSDCYQIFVDPKPVIKGGQVKLEFPEYTKLPPRVSDELAEPLEVLQGASIRIDVDSTLPTAEASLSFNGISSPCEEVVANEKTGLWRHRWEFTATEVELQRGTITLVSEAGVLSEPFDFDVRTLPDRAPSIILDQPALSEVIAKPDQSIRVAYHAVDDFGCGAIQLVTKKNSQPPSTTKLPHDLQAEFEGELTIDLNELELSIGDQLTVWLSVSDNRPDEYGGPQSADSRKIHLKIADDSMPVGQQVVRNEEQSLMADLSEALDQLHLAAKINDELQAHLGETDDIANQEKEGVEKSKQLQNRIKDAEQALRRMTDQNELAPQRLFQEEIERIQEVHEKEVAEARKQAALVPLSDELPQKQESIAATKESLNDAIGKLEQVRADIEERGKQLELAAQLDELARKQNRLAQEQQEGRENVSEVQKQQQQVADALQKVVEQDLDAKSEQFAQRAKAAEKLTKAAAELQQQQQALAKLDQIRSKEELDDKLLEMIAQEQEQIAGETKKLEEQQKDVQPQVADPRKQAQEQPRELAKAERKENPTVLAEARKQMEAVPEKIRQKELQQAEVEARQAREGLQEEAKSAPKNEPMHPNGNEAGGEQQKKEKLERLAKQQERVQDAIKAVRENRPEEAVAKLQEQIANRTEQLRDKADELLQLPTKDPENQQALREAREKLERAEQETKAAEQLAKRQGKQADGAKQADDAKQAVDRKDAANPEQAPDEKQAGAPEQAAPEQEAPPKAGDAKKVAERQKQAAKSLEEAAKSLNKVCKSCKKCSKCNKPGGSSGSSSNSPQSGEKPGDSKPGGKTGESGKPSSKQPQPGSQNLAAATDKAHQTARKPSPQQTQQLAQELNQLADDAAQRAGRPDRGNSEQQGAKEKSTDSSEAAQQAGSPQPRSQSKPQGVQGNAGAGTSEVAQAQLRGPSTSNWTQSRRKLKNNVLDDQDSKIPEEFRGVVKDYFEELSRLESRQDAVEKQK